MGNDHRSKRGEDHPEIAAVGYLLPDVRYDTPRSLLRKSYAVFSGTRLLEQFFCL